MGNSSLIRSGSVFGIAGAGILVLMVAIGIPAGDQLAFLGQPGTPEQYASALKPVANVLVTVMALDNLFLIAYTGTFIAAAALVWEQARLLAAAGLVFAVLLALLDVTENAISVQLARAALAGAPVRLAEITALGVLAQVKYASGALALAFFGAGILIALPRRPLPVVVALLFFLFPLVNSLTVVIQAATWLLILWMLVMLVGGAVLLWRESGGR